MKLTRVANRGRIAPSSPQQIIDSGRTSWSSASAVSTIDTKSPEPRLTEEVTQKLQESITTSTTKKNLIIGLSIAAAFIIVVLCVVLPITLIKGSHDGTSITISPTTVTNSTTVTL